MRKLKAFGEWFILNWERVLFVLVGLILLGGSLTLVYHEKVADAAVVFGLGFLSFIYANVARFKRFKGLGFEAELWEDKQKEAADLIERLRGMVSIYTREIVLGNVKAGRWAGRSDWAARWKLYDDLVAQHHVLGQKIDFSNIKKEMDDYFLFDMSMSDVSKVSQGIGHGKGAAMEKINEEFGRPVRDVEGYKKRVAEHREIPEPIGDPFEFSTQNDLAGQTLKAWEEAHRRLKRDFGVDTGVDAKALERLTSISKLYQLRPVLVTNELIAWANHEP